MPLQGCWHHCQPAERWCRSHRVAICASVAYTPLGLGKPICCVRSVCCSPYWSRIAPLSSAVCQSSPNLAAPVLHLGSAPCHLHFGCHHCRAHCRHLCCLGHCLAGCSHLCRWSPRVGCSALHRTYCGNSGLGNSVYCPHTRSPVSLSP